MPWEVDSEGQLTLFDHWCVQLAGAVHYCFTTYRLYSQVLCTSALICPRLIVSNPWHENCRGWNCPCLSQIPQHVNIKEYGMNTELQPPTGQSRFVYRFCYGCSKTIGHSCVLFCTCCQRMYRMTTRLLENACTAEVTPVCWMLIHEIEELRCGFLSAVYRYYILYSVQKLILKISNPPFKWLS